MEFNGVMEHPWFDSHFHADALIDNNQLKVSESFLLNSGGGIVSILDYALLSKLVNELSCYKNISIINKNKFLSNNYNLFMAVGVHPMCINSVVISEAEESILKFEDFLKGALTNIFALGEVGLDFRSGVVEKCSKEVQEYVFIRMVYLAKYFDLPLIIHSVRAYGRVLDILQRLNFKGNVYWHGFSGSAEFLKRIMSLDRHYVGIGNSLFLYGLKTEPLLKFIRLNRLLLETDAPYMALSSNKHGMLFDICNIGSRVAHILNVTPEFLCESVFKNSLSFLNIK